MTTYVTFAPSATSNFQFQCQLDGNTYNVVVTWSLFGARYYINVYSLAGVLIVSLPMTGSPNALNLSSATYANGIATVTTSDPHTFKVGSVVVLTVSNASPTDYNGTYQCRVLNNTQLSYPISTQPSASSTTGSIAYNINLLQGYFTTSTLVWRVENNQFEVSP